jgi:hypothetical protein
VATGLAASCRSGLLSCARCSSWLAKHPGTGVWQHKSSAKLLPDQVRVPGPDLRRLGRPAAIAAEQRSADGPAAAAQPQDRHRPRHPHNSVPPAPVAFSPPSAPHPAAAPRRRPPRHRVPTQPPSRQPSPVPVTPSAIVSVATPDAGTSLGRNVVANGGVGPQSYACRAVGWYVVNAEGWTDRILHQDRWQPGGRRLIPDACPANGLARGDDLLVASLPARRDTGQMRLAKAAVGAYPDRRLPRRLAAAG